MAISLEQVEKISKLARLEFSEAEKQKLQSELTGILDYVDQINEIQSQNEEWPAPEAQNLMRDDVSEELSSPSALLAQVPEKEGNFIKVKSILD